MRKLLMILACGALVAPPVFAAGHINVSGLIRPGLYQITTKMLVQGMPAGMPSMPAHTQKTCVTKYDIQHFSRNMVEQMKKSKGVMRVEDMLLHGNHLHFKVITHKGAMIADVIFDDPTHYHQTMTGAMGKYHMTWHGTARRIGACKPKHGK